MILIGAVAGGGLWAFVYKTRFGVMLRATSQDMRMAAALGVNVKRDLRPGVRDRVLHGGPRRRGGHAHLRRRAAAWASTRSSSPSSSWSSAASGRSKGALAGAMIVGAIRTLGITYFAEVELAVLYLIAAVVLFVRPAGLFGRA